MNPIKTLALCLALAVAPGLAAADGQMPAGAVHLGALVLSGGFSRATLPNAPVAGGFLTIENTGDTADRLLGASSPVAGRAEVHEMAMEGSVMKMRALPDGLPIPAHKTVTLQPGGYHIMFMDLKHPLKQGDTVMVTLKFQKAGQVTLPLAIGAPNAKGAGKAGMKGMGGMSSGALAPTPALPGVSTAEAG